MCGRKALQALLTARQQQNAAFDGLRDLREQARKEKRDEDTPEMRLLVALVDLGMQERGLLVERAGVVKEWQLHDDHC